MDLGSILMFAAVIAIASAHPRIANRGSAIVMAGTAGIVATRS